MTDFEDWLDANEPDGHDEIFGLYRCVVEGDNWGPYTGTHDDNGRVFIKGPAGSLALVSDSAIKAFIRTIREKYMDGNRPDSMDPEGWYGFHRAMAKDD